MLAAWAAVCTTLWGAARPAPGQAAVPAAPQNGASVRAASAPSTSGVAAFVDPVAVLNDPRASTADREEAARRLVLRDTDESHKAILRILSDAGNRPAQRAVARAIPLDPTPDQLYVKPLLSLIGSDQALSEAAIGALATFADQDEVHARLIQLAADEQHQLKDSPVRLAAIRALGSMSDKAAARTLVDIMNDEQAAQPVRDAAQSALGELAGEMNSDKTIAQWRQWWAAQEGLSDAAFSRQMLMARSASLSRLQARFNQLSDDSRRLLTESYQLAPDKNKESLLLHYLRSNDPQIRALGAELVQEDFKQGRPPTQQVRDQIRSMVADSSSDVRVAIAQTLFTLNDAQAVNALLEQLSRESNNDVKIELIRAIVPMRGEVDRVVPVLLQLLNDPSFSVAAAAARALADPDNLAPQIRKDPALAKRVADELRKTYERQSNNTQSDMTLRVALIDAMGAMRQPQLGQEVFSQLVRPDQPVPIRCAALRALGELGKPQGDTWPANYIVDSLSDSNAEVRLAAVKALMTTAGINQAERLFDFVKRDTTEPDPRVRQAAWETLRAIFTDPQSRASNETLNRWADRFPVDQQPERREEILRVLASRLQAQNNAPQLAAVRQNIGEALMSEHAQAMARGQDDLARARAEEASNYFELALAYYRQKYPTDQNMTTSALLEQRMNALLASGQYEQACQFAADSIAANQGNQERLGPKLRNEVDRLGRAGKISDALRLVDLIKKMNPPLADPYASQIAQLQQSLQARPATSQP